MSHMRLVVTCAPLIGLPMLVDDAALDGEALVQASR